LKTCNFLKAKLRNPKTEIVFGFIQCRKEGISIKGIE